MTVCRTPSGLLEYGNPRVSFHGSGVLTFGDNEFPCNFEAGQLADGEVLALCLVAPWPPIALDAIPSSFRGETDDGWLLASEGAIDDVNYLPDTKHDLDSYTLSGYRLRQMHVTRKDVAAEPAHILRYGITNFVSHWNHAKDSVFGEKHILATVPAPHNIQFAICPVLDYEKIASRLITIKTTDVSAEIVFAAIDAAKVADLDELVSELCYLLSVARGTRINWVYCESYGPSRELLSRRLESRITKRYTGLSVIDPYDGSGAKTAGFIEEAYPGFAREKYRFELTNGTLDGYLDAKAEGDFLEFRGAKLAVALEMLRHLWQRITRPVDGVIVDRSRFGKLVPRLCESMEATLRNHAIAPALAAQVASKGQVRRLNEVAFTSFEKIIEDLCETLKLELRGDLPLFIACRNSLVHTGRFFFCITGTPEERAEHRNAPPDPVSEYFFLVSVLDRIVLRLLDYNGQEPRPGVTRLTDRGWAKSAPGRLSTVVLAERRGTLASGGMSWRADQCG